MIVYAHYGYNWVIVVVDCRCSAVITESDVRSVCSIIIVVVSVVCNRLAAPAVSALRQQSPASRTKHRQPPPSPSHSAHSAAVRHLTMLWTEPLGDAHVNAFPLVVDDLLAWDAFRLRDQL